MRKVIEKIRNSNKNVKIAAVVLATAVCVTSIWHGFSKKPVEVSAETTVVEKTYLSYILDRMIGGLQEEFTILEIVPHTAMGEFRYYTGQDEVTEGDTTKGYIGLNNRQEKLDDYYWYSDHDLWYNIMDPFTNFGYQVRYNTATSLFEAQSPDRFLNYVLPEYKYYFDGKIAVNTVEANELTADDLNKADFIVIASGMHDSSSMACFDDFTGNTTGNYNTYKKNDDGTFTELTSHGDVEGASYNAYEKVTVDGTETYISKDMSWEMTELLFKNTLQGKDIELSDGSTVKINVPVILDMKKFSSLNKDGNMYKYQLIFRMLNNEQYYGKFIDYFKNADSTGKLYINSEGINTAYLDVNKAFAALEDGSTELQLDREDIYTIIGGNSSSTDIYREANPPHSDYLTDNYWVYNGNSCLVPSNIDAIYKTSGAGDEQGFYDRVGGSATAVDVMRFLLGAVDDPVIKYNRVKILEVEPCTSFTYDSYTAVLGLANKMLLDTDGILKDSEGNSIFEPLTEDNYDDPNANTCIYVECMSSSAFNGINTDIVAEYDALFFGMNDTLLLKDSAGSTIYNDTSLNGYVYLAFGDMIEAKTGISVYYPDDYVELASKYTLNSYSLSTDLLWNIRNLQSDAAGFTDSKWQRYQYLKLYEMNTELWNPLLYNNLTADKYYVLENTDALAQNVSTTEEMFADKAGNVRLSGNDITQLKANLVKEFMDAGKLVIFGDDLYNYTDASTTVYPTSNMAEIAQYAITKNSNRIKESRIASMLLYLRNENPKLNYISLPTAVTHGADGSVQTFNAGTVLPIKLEINGKADTSYKIKILIDKNNDGVFDEDADVTTDLNEIFKDPTVTTDANGYAFVDATTELSDNYSGLISYKIEVVELSAGIEQPFRAGMTGYTAIKGDKPKDIKVLQILPVPYSNKVSHLNMQTDADFNALLDAAADIINYNISVETIYTIEYEAKFDPDQSGMAYDNTSEETIAETNWLAPYDMVVLGFSDLYCGDDICDDNGALTCLNDFIDSGKAVLFTHDTVAYSNTVNGMTYETKTTTSGGRFPTTTTSMSLIKHGTNTWGTSLSRMFREKVGMDRFGITKAASEEELRNAPVDKDGNIVYGLQGVTNMLAYRHSLATSSTSGVSYTMEPTSGKYLLYPYTTGSVSDYNTLIDTTQVKKLNEGQVTMYPYYISNDLTVAETHSQWYQLDLEDPSIVVWYTLAGDGSADSVTANTNDQYYTDTDKDAANNYYIYSKGNITYSGAGHSEMDSPEELKLFVNTVVKAITAGNNKPDVRVVDSSYDSGTYTVYITPYSGNYGFTFYGEDLDLRPYVGRFKTAKVTWINTLVDINSDGVIDDKDYVTEDYGNTLTSLTRKTVDINSGGTGTFDAYADAINDYIDGGGEVSFQIELTDMYNDKGEAVVRVVKRDLFDLD